MNAGAYICRASKVPQEITTASLPEKSGFLKSLIPCLHQNEALLLVWYQKANRMREHDPDQASVREIQGEDMMAVWRVEELQSSPQLSFLQESKSSNQEVRHFAACSWNGLAAVLGEHVLIDLQFHCLEHIMPQKNPQTHYF